MAVASVKQPKILGPRKEKVNKMMIIQITTSETQQRPTIINKRILNLECESTQLNIECDS